MKTIILAAGKGSRLGQGRLPKPLTVLDTGKSILEHQLHALSLYTSLDDVIVVVGYEKAKIMERFPDLLYVYNACFAAENTSKSLYRALKKCHEDVLWLNGDVVFHPKVLEAVLANPRTSMVVNIGRVGEEEVKYRKNAQGRIVAVSKHVEHPDGEALGINYCTQKDLEKFRRSLENCVSNDYFERGLEMCIQEGMEVWSVPVGNDQCVEIDFIEDLKKANDMLSEWARQEG